MLRTEQEILYNPEVYDVESDVYQIRQNVETQIGILDTVIGTVTSLRARLPRTRGSMQGTGNILICRLIRPLNIIFNESRKIFTLC